MEFSKRYILIGISYNEQLKQMKTICNAERIVEDSFVCTVTAEYLNVSFFCFLFFCVLLGIEPRGCAHAEQVLYHWATPPALKCVLRL